MICNYCGKENCEHIKHAWDHLTVKNHETGFCSKCKEHADFTVYAEGQSVSECCGAKPISTDIESLDGR